MPGSFVLNVADAPAFEHPVAGVRILFERPDAPFPDTGVNIQVLRPGQPNCKYPLRGHPGGLPRPRRRVPGDPRRREAPLRAWDFVHCEGGTPHVFVGAGDRACWILAIGARREEETLDFPAEALAARYGAAVRSPTMDGDEACADWPGGPPPGDAPRVETPWPPR